MTLADLTPDVVLAALLDGKVEVQTSATSKYAIKAYEQAKMPNKGLADEFLTVQNNGVINSRTNPLGLFYGNLALTLYCKANADNTAKTARLKQMVAQCERLILDEGVRGGRDISRPYWFGFDANNVITPPYVNPTNGYATMTINVAWHTTDN